MPPTMISRVDGKTSGWQLNASIVPLPYFARTAAGVPYIGPITGPTCASSQFMVASTSSSMQSGTGSAGCTTGPLW